MNSGASLLLLVVPMRTGAAPTLSATSRVAATSASASPRMHSARWRVERAGFASIILGLQASDTDGRGVRPCDERIDCALLERHRMRQDQRRRADALRRRIDTGWCLARLQATRRLQQPLARHDNPVVGRHEVFAAAVLDRAQAFLYRCVLQAD